MQTSYSLNVIDIPRPCPADWTAMHGNDQVRFCDHCKLNVYNLSEMTRPQAEQLLLEKEGHLCIRLYRRMDGTVITRDCEGAWKLAKKRLSRFAALSCAAILGGLFAPFGVNDQQAMASGNGDPSLPVKLAKKWIAQLQNPPMQGQVLAVAGGIAPPRPMMGEVAVAPATQPTCEPEQGNVGEKTIMGKVAVTPIMGTTRPTTQPAAEK